MQLNGYWFEPRSSARHVATLEVGAEVFSLLTEGIKTKSGLLAELSFSDRIGNTPRRVLFTDGSVFETQDNDLVDEMQAMCGTEHFLSKYVHILESQWRWVLASVVCLVLLGYFVASVVFPWAGRELAYVVPAKVNASISSGGMYLLDQQLFETSDLGKNKKGELKQTFAALLKTLPDSEFDYRLYFRKMEGEANAFSLPAGEIILTDELVGLAENREQIQAILLHEIGHIHHRHVLQQIIRSSLISVVISMATSDLSALEDLVVVLPVFLLESSYSQANENEADDFMYEQMRNLQMNPIHFANILSLITQDESDIDGTALKYFSSHPETTQRIEGAIRKSKEFLGVGGVF